MSSNRPTVLILASDPAFSREIIANWPQDHAPNSDVHSDTPEFIVLHQAFSRDLKGSNYDLAIADASSYEKRTHKGDNHESKDRKDQSSNKDQSTKANQSIKKDENNALKERLNKF